MVCGFWFVEALSPGLHEGRGFGIFWGNADGCAFFFVHGGGRGSVLSRVRVMGYTTPCTMHKRTPLIVAIGTITFLAFCNKGSGEGPEGMSPVRDFIASTRSAGEQSFVLDASAGGMITGARGTIIVVAPQAFRRHDGGVVTGPVTVRLLEAYEVGDMVALNMQTVARNGAGKMALHSAIEGFVLQKMISEHDALIAKKLANVLTGGNLPAQGTVSEQYLLDIEREAFLRLIGEEKTQERIMSLLTTGKAVRN